MKNLESQTPHDTELSDMKQPITGVSQDSSALSQTSNNDDSGSVENISTVQKIILTLVLTITLFMTSLEQTITTAALPQISADLRSNAGYTWIGTGFLLASSSAMPIYGKLSDVYGRKPIILWAIGMFIIGSIVAGAANSMSTIIGGRVIQGFGGGGISGLCNIIVSDMVPLRQRGLFMSVIGSTYMVASCIGPIVGGSLSERGKWRWCFYINIPIGGAAWLAIFFGLKFSKPKRQTILEDIKRIDLIGIAICTAATCLLLLALDWGGTVHPWNSPIIICFLVFSFVLYVALIIFEWKIPKEPIISPNLFLNRTRGFAFLSAFFHGISFMGIVYYLPFFFQSVYLVSPITASAYVIPQAVCMGLAAAIGGVIISKLGRYVDMMRVGMALTTASIGLLSTLNPNSNVARRIIYPCLFGLPLGFNFQSFLIALQTQIDRDDTAMATATLSYIRQIGLSVGIAIGGVTFMNRISHLASNSQSRRLETLLQGNAPQSINRVKELDYELRVKAAELYSKAFQTMFYVFIAMCGIGFISSLFIPQNKLEMQERSDIGSQRKDQKEKERYENNNN